MPSVTVTLPLPPNLANERLHWRVKQAKKREYYELAGLMLQAQLPKLRIGLECSLPVQTRVTLQPRLYLYNRMDRDNMVARIKWPQDLLVKHGVLRDDTEEHLDLLMPTQEIDRGNQRLEFELSYE